MSEFVEWFLLCQHGPHDLGKTYYGSDVATSEWPANARLIAAAPELLDAAQRALNYITNTESEFGITLGSGDMLRAAIAKATTP